MDLEHARFESRKADHLRLALDPAMEASGGNGLARIQLLHEALPELDFSEVKIETRFWRYRAASPLFISSMTAGHQGGEALNLTLARVAARRRWPMGVGSQRRELTDPAARDEWKRLRREAKDACLFSNIGLSQAIAHTPAKISEIVKTLEAAALIVHTNPLQEALQPEGTPAFKGGLRALEKLCKFSPAPVILKETGCGFSVPTLRKLRSTGLAVVDVGGFGGTHWGRIEGGRAESSSAQHLAAQTFADWGESTAQSLENAALALGRAKLEIWASGGIRSGLEAAKTLAMGAKKVGFAKPVLESALRGEAALEAWMTRMEFELKVALYCTGSESPEALRKGKRWRKI